MVPAIIPLIALYPPAIPPTYPPKWPITHRPSKGEGLLLERKFASTVSEPCLFFPWAWPVWRVIIQKWSCRGSFRWLRTLNMTGWQHGTGTLGCIFHVSWVDTQGGMFWRKNRVASKAAGATRQQHCCSTPCVGAILIFLILYCCY